MLKIFLSVVMALSGTQVTFAKSSKLVERQLYADVYLDYLFKKIDSIKTVEAFKDLVTAQLTPQGKKAIEKHLSQIKSIPQFTRLNRGFSFVMDGKKFDFGFEDITKAKMSVNGIPFTIKYNEPIDKQIEALGTRLQKTETSHLFYLFIQPAEAVVWWIPLLVGFGLGLVPTAYQMFGKPYFDHAWCKTADKTYYPHYVQCKDYFELKDKMTPSVSKADPKREQIESEESIQRVTCPRKIKRNGKDQMTDMIHTESTTDGQISLKQTISYKVDGTPTKIVDDLFNPVRRTITYELNPEGKLHRVTDTESLFLSRDPGDSGRMQGVNLERFAIYDRNVSIVEALYKAKCAGAGRAVEDAATVSSIASRGHDKTPQPPTPKGRE